MAQDSDAANETAVSTETDPLRRMVPLAAGIAAVGAVLVDPGTAVENVVALAAVVPFMVWAWRGMPTLLLVAIAAAVALFALGSGGLEPLLFLVSMAATTVGGWERSQRSLVAAALLAGATPVAAEILHHDGLLYGVWIMGIVFPLVLARGFRWQLDVVNQLAKAREELARQAVLDEKRRIARDVHDLVGHGLATVLLHVTGARYVLRRDADAAEAALADAEAVGRRSMQELRRTLGVLRSSDPAESNVAPPPGAGELVDVIAATRATGVDVDFRSEGDLDRIDPVAGLALYRVAEEALANVRRHAPQAVTDVLLVVEEQAVALTVESIGPLEQPASGDARPRYGIVGMRERMGSIGGELDAGPTTTGWLVRARAPLKMRDGFDTTGAGGDVTAAAPSEGEETEGAR